MPVGFDLQKQGPVTYLTVPSFAATGVVAHAFTTRHGGTSPAPFNEMNLDFKVGDNPHNVIANRETMCRILGADLNQLVAADQVHGRRVVTVDASRAGKGARSNKDALPGVDALVTEVPGLVLSSYYADCVPLLFLDPVNRVVALAHAGWKGTVLGIGGRTVRHMTEKHGCRIQNILAAVGPCIGPCCYEVDEPVMQRVEQSLPGEKPPAVPAGTGHWWLDLPELNRLILLRSGINKEQITMSGYCTACRNDLFYSHRKHRGRTGRMASLIMLIEG